jgi:hypothetical protein
MSLYGEWKAATIEEDGTSSAEVDLGREYDYLLIQIPTLVSCTVKLQVAEKTGGTFYDLGDDVTTTAGTHNYADIFPLYGYQFIKVVASETQTGSDKEIRVRGMRF